MVEDIVAMVSYLASLYVEVEFFCVDANLFKILFFYVCFAYLYGIGYMNLKNKIQYIYSLSSILLYSQIVRCKTCEFSKLNRPNQRYVRVTEPWEVRI